MANNIVTYTEQDLLRAVSEVESLHASAHVLAKAFEILNDPDSNQMDLVDTIKTDSAITSDILRISNSAFYGGNMKIASLDDAIHRLGFREVMKLVSISMSKQMFNKALVHYGISAQDYWRQSAAVAAAMENLSDLLDEDRSYYFTIGILHAIGRIVIDHTLCKRNSEVRWDKSVPVEQWETTNFGFDYTDAGHTLLTAWNFPQKILAVILNQITPEFVNNPPNALLCVNFAIRWCRSHNYFRATSVPEVAIEPWMIPLEVTQADLEDLYQNSAHTYDELERMAGM